MLTRQAKRRIWLPVAATLVVIVVSLLFSSVPRMTIRVKEKVIFQPLPDEQYYRTVSAGSVADLKRLIEADPVHARNVVWNGDDLIGIALSWKRVDDVELLLQEGFNVNAMSHGDTPLIVAASWGDDKLVTMLLKYGADPELCDSYGKSPQQIAKERGYDNTVSILQNEIDHRKSSAIRLPTSRPF